MTKRKQQPSCSLEFATIAYKSEHTIPRDADEFNNYFTNITELVCNATIGRSVSNGHMQRVIDR